MKLILVLAFAMMSCRPSGHEEGELAELGETSTFGIADIKKLIADNPQMRTGEELLEALPSALLSRYTILHTSRSIQNASSQNPRVILFSDKFFIGFNGDSSQRGNDRIELMEYDRKKHQFNLAEVRLAEPAGPTVVENPKICSVCHGADAHPLWDPYAEWPGAFDTGDHFFNTKWAEAEFKRFSQGNAKKGRYQKLKDLSTYTSRTPSRDLANVLDKLLEDRIAYHLFPSIKNLSSYVYALQAVDSRCSDIESFIPASLATKFKSNYQSVKSETNGRYTQFSEYRINLARVMGHYREGDDVPYSDLDFSTERDHNLIAGLRYLLERDGGSIGYWFSTIGMDVYRMPRDSTATKLGQGLAKVSIPYLVKQGIDLQDCNKLKRASLKALENLQTTSPDPIATGNPKPLSIVDSNKLPQDQFLRNTYQFVASSCSNCHQAGGDVPKIPFLDPAAMAKELQGSNLLSEIERRIKLPANARDVMPPAAPIQDLDIINGFLQALKYVKEH